MIQRSLTLEDLGGQWTSDIFAMYACEVYVFEPVPEFAAQLARRFARNSRIHVFDYGLAEKTYSTGISISGDASNIRTNNSPKDITANFVEFSKFCKLLNIAQIDLVKINIEGSEFELLEHLIATGQIASISNIQVQFHDFVPEAYQRMRHIQDQLSKTHETTFQFEFVWENWRRRQ